MGSCCLCQRSAGSQPVSGCSFCLATKRTKKCLWHNQCRANGGRSRLKSRGDCTVDSFPCQGNVPGASISLREDDAGPRLRRDARGRAYRAGGFIPPSEYEIIGAPTKSADFVGHAAGPCGLLRCRKDIRVLSSKRKSSGRLSRPELLFFLVISQSHTAEAW